jgi:FKBP-type peptidyl-prolyl cis-trans isomerase FkpA
LQDGTVFDASRFENRSKEQQKMMRLYQPSLFDDKGNLLEPSEPIEFPLDRVIKGWTEGMKLVGPGGKIMLYIPAELAYGSHGAGPMIGPNEALEFEVELIDVKPAEVEPNDPTKENIKPLPTKVPAKVATKK